MMAGTAKHRRRITLALLAGLAVGLYAATLLRFGTMLGGG